MTTPSLSTLFARALTGDEDDEQTWEAIRLLHKRSEAEVFDAASSLMRSKSANERGRGADILAQLGTPEPPPELRARCADVILEVLAVEQSPLVLHSIAVALGHVRDARAVGPLVRLASHAEARVRRGVVFGLIPQSAPDSIEALVRLSSDDDEEVRDWATFALGTMPDVDTPALRDALVARLTDASADVRGEALAGLASRNDQRVLEPLQRELMGASVGILAVEAAASFGDASVLPQLLALRERVGDATSAFKDTLEEAIATLDR